MPESLDSHESLVDVAIAEYLRAKETPHPFDIDEWLLRHPQAADALCEFLRDEGVFGDLVAPLLAAPDTTRSHAGVVNDSTLTVEGERRRPRVVESRSVGFDDFEILDEIARGGMGVVYRARQRSLNRIVALKMVLGGGFASQGEAERLYREAEAAAGLDHPNIVPVYEIGEHEGRPFFAMKLVPGGSLADHAADLTNRPREVAALVATVARAVYHAHQRGVLHRDLKPSNILLDGTGAPHVTDFGLARRLGPGASVSGAVAGTPSYMAPEQARGEKGLTTAVDVYGLGGVLYFLLTGVAPFKAESTAEVLLMVLAIDPVPPRVLRPDIPRDLETICMKCLAKEPGRRYASAAELADDLGRWLAGEPITARQTSRAERAIKWVRRHPAGTAVAAMSVLLLLATVGGGVALAYSQTLAGKNHDLGQARNEAEEQRIEAEKQRVRAEGQEAESRRLLYLARMHQANVAFQAGNIERVIELLTPYRTPEPGKSDPRGFEWYYLWRSARGDQFTVHSHAGGITTVDFSLDGKVIATGGADGAVRLWDAANGQPRGEFDTGPGEVTGVRFVPGTSLLAASVSTTTRGVIVLWDSRTRQETRRVVLPGRVKGLAVSLGGKHLATACDDGFTRVVEVGTGAIVFEQSLRKASVTCVAFSRDGRRLASGDDEGRVQTWEWPEGSLLLDEGKQAKRPGPLEPIRDLTFGADSNKLVVAVGVSSEVKKEGGQIYRLTYQPGAGSLAAFHNQRRNSSWITRLAYQQAARTEWDWVAVAFFYERHEYRQVRVLPDGVTAIAVADDGTVRMIDVTRGTRRELRQYSGHTGPVQAVAISVDGGFLATAGSTRTPDGAVGELRLWDHRADVDPLRVRAHTNVHAVSISADGSTVAAVTKSAKGRVIRVTDATSGRERFRADTNEGEYYEAALSPDGRWVAAPGPICKVWRTDTGAEHYVTAPPKDDNTFLRVAFSRDGHLLALGTGNGVVQIHDLIARRLVKEWNIDPARLLAGWTCSIDFSPDSQRLVTCSEDELVRVWRLATGVCELTFGPGMGNTYAAVFSADGQSIATAGAYGLVSIWDASDGRRRVTLSGHDTEKNVYSCHYTADGSRLVTASEDGTVRVWATVTGQELLTLRPFGDYGDSLHVYGSLYTAAVSADGFRIAVNSALGLVQVIGVPSPVSAADPSPEDLVHVQFRRLALQDEVMATLRADRTLSEPLRSAALKLATEQKPDVELIWDAMQAELDAIIAKKSKRSDRLLRLADTVLKLEPQFRNAELARGVALYQLGRDLEAEKSLGSTGTLINTRDQYPVEEGYRLAFLTMAQARSGQREAARKTFDKLTQIVASAKNWGEESEVRQCYWEAARSVGVFIPVPRLAPKAIEPAR